METIPEILHKVAKEVQSLLDQLHTFQTRYSALETQLRIIQNDLWAAESELAMMRQERANQPLPNYIRK